MSERAICLSPEEFDAKEVTDPTPPAPPAVAPAVTHGRNPFSGALPDITADHQHYYDLYQRWVAAQTQQQYQAYQQAQQQRQQAQIEQYEMLRQLMFEQVKMMPTAPLAFQDAYLQEPPPAVPLNVGIAPTTTGGQRSGKAIAASHGDTIAIRKPQRYSDMPRYSELTIGKFDSSWFKDGW